MGVVAVTIPPVSELSAFITHLTAIFAAVVLAWAGVVVVVGHLLVMAARRPRRAAVRPVGLPRERGTRDDYTLGA